MKGIRRYVISYPHSIRGIWIAMLRDDNIRIHLTAMIAALLGVTSTEWIISLMLGD